MYRNYNPYLPYGQMPQPVQRMGEQNPQASCFFVKSADEFKVDVLPGVIYLGINDKDSELYVRKINDLGNPEFKIYKLVADKKEKTEMQQIVDKLDSILDIIKEKEDGTIAGNETDNK